MVLKSLIAQSDQTKKSGKMSWDHLSAASMKVGGMSVDFDSFEQLSSRYPVLQSLVVDYNKDGIILANQKNRESRDDVPENPDETDTKTTESSKRGLSNAMRASSQFIKKRLRK